MNAAERLHSIDYSQAIASVITLVRTHFPEASANLKPWRDDPETRLWYEGETLDLAFYFPGWSPKLQCRSFLLQLIMHGTLEGRPCAPLMGVIIRGMTFAGEDWRLVTLDDWRPSGAHLPLASEVVHLHQICKDLFILFPMR